MEKITPTPEGFDLLENTQGIAITYRWYQPLVWFLLFFALFWNGFLVGWFTAETPIYFKLFALIHLTVGIGLAWYILCLFMNKTEILITSQNFIIKHSPIPFPFLTYKNKHLKDYDIQQVYIRQEISQGKNSTSVDYSVNVLSPQGATSKILSFSEYERAIFVKRKIEQYMNIEPQLIEGEYLI